MSHPTTKAGAGPVDETVLGQVVLPASGSEERAFWLEAAVHHGFEETRGDEFTTVYFATEDEVLTLMAAARQQGRDDVAALAPPAAVSREVIAQAIVGPHRPVPPNSSHSLEQLRAVRWAQATRAEQLGALNAADAVLAAVALAPPAAVPESVRADLIARLRATSPWRRPAIAEDLMAAAADILANSPPSRQAAEGGERRHLTGADRIRYGDLGARDDGNCCAGAPPASAGALKGMLSEKDVRQVADEVWCPPHDPAGERLMGACDFNAGINRLKDALLLKLSLRAELLAAAPATPEPAAGGREIVRRMSKAQAEAAAERVCHDEQMTVWSGDLAAALSMGGFLREDLDYEDKIHLDRTVASQIRDIAESVLSHPELPASAEPRSILSASTADGETAGEGWTKGPPPRDPEFYANLPDEADEGLGWALSIDEDAVLWLLWWEATETGSRIAWHRPPLAGPTPPPTPNRPGAGAGAEEGR